MKIVYFAPIDWDSIKQRPQHFAARLAKKFDFYYIQPLGLRSIKWCDFFRAFHRIKGILAKKNHASNNLQVKNLIFIPLANNFFFHINNWLLVFQLKKIIDKDTVIWVTSPNNLIPALLSSLRFKTLIYEVLDYYAAIQESNRKAIDKTEQLLVKRANFIIVTATYLLEKIKRIDEKKTIHLISNGVDYDFFSQAIVSSVPAELVGMKKIVGYVGSIDKWVDLELINFIAQQRQDLDFVFIGPIKVNSLPQGNNIHFLGARDYSIVPNYLHSFAVCLIPFVPGEFADSINPVKLYEYFACGKPVVANTMQELTPFSDLLYLAKSKEEFLAQLGIALNEKYDSSVAQQRKVLAHNNDWNKKVEAISCLLRDEVVHP